MTVAADTVFPGQEKIVGAAFVRSVVSKREYAAAKCLRGRLADANNVTGNSNTVMGQLAVLDADAFIKTCRERYGLKIEGLMCVPPVEYQHEEAFAEIAQIHQRFSANYPQGKSLSAGMSSDFEIAIAHGATHLRVGSEILGSRTYHP